MTNLVFRFFAANRDGPNIEENMKKSLLDPGYDKKFDDKSYPPPTHHLLRGLAAAIQDSQEYWRPTITEIIGLLPPSEQSNKLVLAGTAYGAARMIQDDFPGPALLLYGAAINIIGVAPNTKLKDAIDKGVEKLSNNNLLDDLDIKTIVSAAKERASFDKVSEMLRNEFSEGLRSSHKFSEDTINKVVPQIVNATHDVRHKGLIDRFGWAVTPIFQDEFYITDPREIKEMSSSTDVSFFHIEGPVNFSKSFFQDLMPYAQIGCAQAILKRIKI